MDIKRLGHSLEPQFHYLYSILNEDQWEPILDILQQLLTYCQRVKQIQYLVYEKEKCGTCVAMMPLLVNQTELTYELFEHILCYFAHLKYSHFRIGTGFQGVCDHVQTLLPNCFILNYPPTNKLDLLYLAFIYTVFLEALYNGHRNKLLTQCIHEAKINN